MLYAVESKQFIDGEVVSFHKDSDRIQANSWDDAEIELFLQGKHNTHTIIGELIKEYPVSDEFIDQFKNHNAK